MLKASRKFKAWLVTWEWMGDHAKRNDKIVAVFGPRLSPFRVRELVELLYLNIFYGVAERVYYAVDRKRNPFRASFTGGQPTRWPPVIHCVDNPFLMAHLVQDLAIERRDKGNETVIWQEVRTKRWHKFTSKQLGSIE